MTKASNRLASLGYRLGTYRRARLDAANGTRAPKIAQGSSAPSARFSPRFATTTAALAITLACVSGSIATAAAQAETLSPWFHLSSVARPANLQQGVARNEVQEIAMPTEASFEMLATLLGGARVQVGPFATEPGGAIPEATAANVQKALEAEAVYGAGQVQVTGGLVAAGTGDLSAGAGIGTLTKGSTEVTGVLEAVGAFEHGQEISGAGIPAGTTIAAVDKATETLTLSAAATEAGIVELHAGSRVVTGVATAEGAFAAGQEIAGAGIPTGTTITAVDALTETLTLSAPATEAGAGVPIAGRTPFKITIDDRSVRPLRIQERQNDNIAKVLGEGRSDGEIVVTAINLGDASANVEAAAGGVPIKISDVLPEHVKARFIEGNTINNGGVSRGPVRCEVGTLTCTFGEGCKPKGNVCNVEQGLLPPFDEVEVVIGVEPEPGAVSGELNTASVSGGGAPPAGTSHPIAVAKTPGSLEATPLGVETWEAGFEETGGSSDAQAGSHPFQFTTTFNVSETVKLLEGEEEPEPAVLPKDVTVKLPPGLIGNPTAYPRCTLAQFSHLPAPQCAPDTALGVAVVKVHELIGMVTAATPIYNLEPSEGEPARFGYAPGGVPVFLDTSVRTGEDYGVTVRVPNIPETVGFLTNTLTFWGVPGDARHNDARGVSCLAELFEGAPRGCSPLEDSDPQPFLALPTSCTGELRAGAEMDGWENQGVQVRATTADSAFASVPMPAMDGCSLLPFGAQIEVSPDVQEASKPSGLKVDVHVPQEEALNAHGLAPAMVRNITVALPPEVHLNPSSADGLQACSSNPSGLPENALGSPGDQIGYAGKRKVESLPGIETLGFTPYLPGDLAAKGAAEDHEIPGSEATLQPGLNFCANASKIATVKITTPLLPKGENVEGFVYLAAQEANPFSSLLAMYIVAEDPVSGTVVKLPGEVQICRGAGEVLAGMTCHELGQLVTTFENNPQLPFEDAELHFYGGERAPLATPARCGSDTTEASFEPWTNTADNHEDLHSESTFSITEGPDHTACPGPSLPFHPSLTGGALNVNAGAFSPFDATFSRQSGEQNMQQVVAKLPPGLSGILTGVELCPEPQANLGECGPNSLIGETTVSVGVGGEPYTVSGGKFYLTGPYEGAPFGITFTVPAKAGPFDLANTQHNKPPCDCVLVRGKIEINPLTSALTITSNAPGTTDSIPTELEGIPLEIQHINATTTRSNFQFNPTNCSKMEVTGTIRSTEGGADAVSVPFQVTNCAALKFEPKFSVSTSGRTSKADGASLTAKVTYPKVPQGTDADIAKVKVELPKQLPSRLTTLQKACTAKRFELNPANCPKESKIGYAVVHTPLIPVPLEGPAIFVSHGGEAFPSLTMVLQGYGITIDLVGTTFISKSGITSTTFKSVPDQPFSSFQLTLPEGKYSALAANGNLCSEASKLTMPTEFVSQAGGNPLKQITKIAVSGCKKTLTRSQKLKAALKACHKDKNKGKRQKCEAAAHRKFGPVKSKHRKKA